MPNPYFSDGEYNSPQEPTAEKPQDAEDSDSQTTLIPKSLCPGMEPGQEIVLKIDAVEENEYLVSYAPKKGEDDSESDSESEPPMPPGKPSMYD